MKKQILVLLAFLIVLLSCNSSSKSYSHSPRDTSTRLALYQHPAIGIRYSDVKIYSWDSLMYVNKDENTLTKKWSRYKLFAIPITDTARDIKGLPLKDTSGKFQFSTQYVPVADLNVMEVMNINLDSLKNAINQPPKTTPIK